jgi:UDP-N-acetylmuramoyl-tripeptide--D-alanyl-D-alanine ligase
VTTRRMYDAARRAVRLYFGFWARLVLWVHHPLVIGVTGSVGKTTTKEMIAAVLSHPQARHVVGRIHKSPGNLNDDLGLPLAILQFPDWAKTEAELVRYVCLAPFKACALAFFARRVDVLVLEYALSPDSNFATLIRLARPTVAVVTAIGPAHLETFGTIEGVAREKAQLVQAVPDNGLVVLGKENPCLADMARATSATVVTVDGIGRELASNVARAVGAYVGVPPQAAEDAIAHAGSVTRRLKVFDFGPIVVIDDTINANPMSMRLALTTLAARATNARRRVAVLGFMAELGADAQAFHREIGAFAKHRADLVVGVGALAREYDSAYWFADATECAEHLPRILQVGDVVLVKGSASAHMDIVAGALKDYGRALAGTAA